jgi:hypothetical protein
LIRSLRIHSVVPSHTALAVLLTGTFRLLDVVRPGTIALRTSRRAPSARAGS